MLFLSLSLVWDLGTLPPAAREALGGFFGSFSKSKMGFSTISRLNNNLGF